MTELKATVKLCGSFIILLSF